jgi:raffinose/stachyose/melibiose transport system permease protein
MDKHKGTRTINSNTTADFHADYATLFVVVHYEVPMSATTRLTAIVQKSSKTTYKESNEYRLTTILFLLPTLIVLFVFVVWPIISSAQLSFVKWDGNNPNQKYVGFDNWATLLQDPVFWQALKNNVIVVVLSIVIQLPIAMALAVLLERGGRKLQIFKVIYFFPLLMSTVAVGILFKYIYDPQFGLITNLLQATGVSSPDWLGDPHIALLSVIAVICWQFTPFYMILFLAALNGIPDELRDAARIDGATENQFFWAISLPLVRGTIRTGAILSLIGSLKYFDLIWVMTEGGPSGSSELMATYMYRKACPSFNVGYGSTIATALFVVVMVVSLVTFFLTRNAEQVA